MKRSLPSSSTGSLRDNPVPARHGALHRGTGIVPPDDVALAPGMRTEVRIPGIGELRNPVHALPTRDR